MFLLPLFIIPHKAVAASETQAEKINRKLQSTPMKGTGKIVVNQARKYGINPFFIVAVAGKESSFGAAPCSDNTKNVWGLGACGRAWETPYFENWIQAINYFVRFIDSRWPNAQNPFQFYGYCNGCESEWGNDVAGHMLRLGGSSRVR